MRRHGRHKNDIKKPQKIAGKIYLTYSQYGVLLGVSERQAQRYGYEECDARLKLKRHENAVKIEETKQELETSAKADISLKIKEKGNVFVDSLLTKANDILSSTDKPIFEGEVEIVKLAKELLVSFAGLKAKNKR